MPKALRGLILFDAVSEDGIAKQATRTVRANAY